MTNALAKVDAAHLAAVPDSAAIELVLVQGDLSKLTVAQRVSYYNQVCNSVGLNPLTRPFEYLNLNGALRLYARRDCTDQLRKIHNVSVRITARDRGDDVYVVTAQATFPNGRSDESTGAVPIARLQGEALANALMKAETKAKRRVTLSICGLSVLDESELDGVREMHPQQGPHSPHDDGPPDDSKLDPARAEDLITRLTEMKAFIGSVENYQMACDFRAMIGTPEKQSPILAEMQAAKMGKMLTIAESKKIGALWHHCDREAAKLLKKLAPPAEDSFTDGPEVEPDPDGDGR